MLLRTRQASSGYKSHNLPAELTLGADHAKASWNIAGDDGLGLDRWSPEGWSWGGELRREHSQLAPARKLPNTTQQHSLEEEPVGKMLQG